MTRATRDHEAEQSVSRMELVELADAPLSAAVVREATGEVQEASGM